MANQFVHVELATNGPAKAKTFYSILLDWPLELLITATLEDVKGKTRLTLRHKGLLAGEMREMCATGWNESFDKLAAILAREGKGP
ncbi:MULTISPECIES: SRPBCC family protein [Geobacter]|uniref:SRPBCC domain-containing protein n=1 Tax=Geobacter anodireducens TaxID=1340425 RepID=A0ABR9NZ06_9BACT|nr:MULTISPECIES: SRPBCC domain-containing protein [Geobacter]ANA39152.1 hypothetical protein A2G06_00705 [Geobacter anodireducens]MBE2889508.1 SRPBCC domain-containing protein [Geobacter anodireducens]HMN01198.1 SRPBCC domain-containing protein [Geobacter anodireducens]